jgi:DNA-binding NarL/FixJ family response regulator
MIIKVLLVDDHKIVRDGLKVLLERENDIRVLAEADNGRMAVQLAKELVPDVVVMDLGMPEMNGFEATRRLSVELPSTRVVALSMHSARRFISEALSAGAMGYLLKDCAAKELVRAIHVVAGGETYLSPAVASVVVKDYVKSSPPSGDSTGKLTAREREVLQLIAEGRNTKEIAFILNLSTKTVEAHRAHIMCKLDLQSIAALTRYAIREGLTPLE